MSASLSIHAAAASGVLALALLAHVASSTAAVSSPAVPTPLQAMPGMSDGPAMAPAATGSAAAPISSHAAEAHAHGMPDMADMSDMAPATAGSAAMPASGRASSAHGAGQPKDLPAAAPSSLPPNDHVPPAAPRHPLPAMSVAAMVDAMQMDDRAWRGMLLADRLERTRSSDGDYASNWDVEGWYGGDIDRLWLRSEGERSRAGTEDARAEVLWGHAFSRYWDWQVGVRQDFGQTPSRQWLAAGVQGLAPYWFDVQASFYAGPQGRTAARLELSRDLVLTQRLILSPQLEVNLYGKDDPQRQVRAGQSDAEAGLRLRYEVSRRFAPYLGIDWQRQFGAGDGLPVARRLPSRETRLLVGVRLWF